MFAFLLFTRIGKAMRAVADNPELARLKGIDADAHRLVTVFVGMGLAGVGGMLIGLDTTIDPLTGYRVMLVGLRRRGGRRPRLDPRRRGRRACARRRRGTSAVRRRPRPTAPPSASSPSCSC